MSHLRLHEAPIDEAIPDTYLFPGPATRPARPVVRPSISGSGAIHPVERDLDHVQARLNNLRDLMDRFGLDLGAGGPRAA